MAKAREPPKTQEGSGSGDLANTGTVRAYLLVLVRVIATLRGIMEPSGRACCVSSRAGGGRMPAGATRACVRAGRAYMCLWQAKNRGVGAPRRGEKKEGPKEGHVSTNIYIYIYIYI
jgi:hypothetical protein